jgi:hypothetical protein
MRVVNFVNNEVEVVRQYTCPHCHYRDTKVNLAATKRYRKEHPDVKPTPIPIPKPVGGLLFGDKLEHTSIEAGIKQTTFNHTRNAANVVRDAVMKAYEALGDELSSALHQGATPEEMVELQRVAEAFIREGFVQGSMLPLRIF